MRKVGKEKKRKRKEEIQNKRKEKKRKGKKTNTPYVIKLGINLDNIKHMYNVTPFFI